MSDINTLNENGNGNIDVLAIREAFETLRGRTLLLSDELLVSVIKRAGKAWDALSEDDDAEEATCLFLEKAEKVAAQVSISDPGITALIARLDTEFYAAIEEDIEHVTKSKVSAVHIMAQFKRLFKKQELASLPWPGTEQAHVEGTNYRPDKVKTVDKSTGQPITTVWTNDFASAMPQGKKYDGMLDDVKKENTSPGSIPRFKGKTEEDLEAIKSDANTRRNALRGLIRKALTLNHQWQAVEGMPLVGLRWIKGNKEHGITMPTKYGQKDIEENFTMVTGAAKCIWLYDTEEPSKGRAVTTTQFNNFNVAEALKNGGTVADLISTAGRGADEATDDEGTGEDMGDETALATFQLVANYLAKTENLAGVLKKIADRKKDADGIEWLELVMEMDKRIHPIAEKNRNSYVQMQNAKMLNADNEAEEEANVA